VAEFATVAEVAAGIGRYAPRVLLTDNADLSLITKIRQGTRTLVYAENVDPAALQAVFRAGAVGFVRKSAPVDQLVTAVRAAANDSRFLEPEIAVSFVLARHDEFLTERERDALDLWAAGHTNAEVARSLRISVRTVESVRADLRCRLGLSSRSSLIQYARERL
jgi:DNA-binding NarL/FixJ family response regulator